MPLKRKQFLKKYASSKNATPSEVQRSGPGYGPAMFTGGAIGGGDGAKDKIGREKISWDQTGFMGSPSMAADAGFSSIVLSRVNKGRDETNEPRPMFPEQDVKEDDEDDNYISEESDKYLKRFLEDIRVSDIKEYFDEDLIINNSRYSLSSCHDLVSEVISWRDIVPDSLEDESVEAYEYVSDVLDKAMDTGRPAYDLVADKVNDLLSDVEPETIQKAKDVAKEIGRDFIALTAVGIPIVGTPIAASYVLYNLNELQEGQAQIRRSIDSLIINGSQQDIVNLERISSEMFDDYIDMMQASTYLIPFIGTAKGLLSAVSSLSKGTRSIARFSGITGGGVLKKAIRSEILLSPIFKFIANFADSDGPERFDIDGAMFFDMITKGPATLVVASDILEMSNRQLAEWTSLGSSGSFKFDPYELQNFSPDVQQLAQDRLTSNNYDSLIDEWLENSLGEINNFLSQQLQQEGLNMKNDYTQLRKFIRETLYHTAYVDSDPLPHGFLYRHPPSSEDIDDLDLFQQIAHLEPVLGRLLF